jgi:hypothetical protein
MNKECKIYFPDFFKLVIHGLLTFKPCNCTIKNALRNTFCLLNWQKI